MADPKLPAQLEEMLVKVVKTAVAGELKGINARLDGIEKDQDQHGKILGSLGAPAVERDPEEAKQQLDNIWQCMKCGARLGFYDIPNDTIRIRYKEHILHSRLGPGGWVKVVCRQCGEFNSLDYVPGPTADGIPVSGGMIVMDVETLARLLEQAQSNQDGTVSIPLLQE